VKALSMYNPWAALVASGAKTIETRSWLTHYRGPLAIHASKRSFGVNSKTADWIGGLDRAAYDRVDDAVEGDPMIGDNYPRGAVIATCQLIDVLPVEALSWVDGDLWAPGVDGDGWVQGLTDSGRPMVTLIDEAERPFGDYSEGRFAWLLGSITRLPEPVPAKGRQGLWNWDDDPR
jgi:hypothetical protein